jgi:hemolysin-activating ACP:hemolysin acyltransferase
MQALTQGDRKLRAARHLLLPAINSGQYLLGSEAGKSVFHMLWANLSPDAEAPGGTSSRQRRTRG